MAKQPNVIMVLAPAEGEERQTLFIFVVDEEKGLQSVRNAPYDIWPRSVAEGADQLRLTYASPTLLGKVITLATQVAGISVQALAREPIDENDNDD